MNIKNAEENFPIPDVRSLGPLLQSEFWIRRSRLMRSERIANSINCQKEP